MTTATSKASPMYAFTAPSQSCVTIESLAAPRSGWPVPGLAMAKTGPKRLRDVAITFSNGAAFPSDRPLTALIEDITNKMRASKKHRYITAHITTVQASNLMHINRSPPRPLEAALEVGPRGTSLVGSVNTVYT